MGPYWSLCVIMCPCGSLLVFIRLYKSFWVLMRPISLYAFLWVHMSLNGSVCALVGPYGSL